MLTGPGGVDEGDVGDGLVFVSYSHADAEWAQRFRVLLKPLVRYERLRLWDDTDIRATQEWHPAIQEAITRSRVALLLISADFLASDYIMDRELPLLVEREVGLAPVLIADCFWRAVPQLAAVQFLHDIGRDGALSRHAGNPGARDRWIRRACERLLEVVPEPDLGHRPLAKVARAPGPTRDPVVVPDDDVSGPLSRVPEPPPGYVAREELDELVEAVLSTAGDGAVGLVPELPWTGLYGIGGIGKSVLAAAVAADDRIRRRHPDGVYWVGVGEHPDLLALQLDLLTRLGAPAEVRTVAEATRALRTALADKRVLLVVDDVWSDASALAFRVTGRRSRVLYTSRDEDVLHAVGAAGRRLGVLSSVAARAVAAAVLQTTADALPDDADRALAAVGHVPLAVALLAAAVRSGRSWTEVDLDLGRDVEVYGTHPYADAFRALAIGAAALPDELRAALFGLVVFAPDTAVPVAAIARYWGHTRSRTGEETVADLDRLAAANLLRREADTVGFHDLAHEYLLLHAEGLPALHAQFLDAYRALLREPDEWWQLPPDEPYVWDHLAAHLAAAGARRTLVATVTDPAYQARRVARDGPQAGEADLAVADRIAPHDVAVGWWLAWLARHGHLLDDAEPHGQRVATTMLAWAGADPTRPASVRLGRLEPLLRRPYLAVHGGLTAASSALVRVLAGEYSVRTLAWSPDGARLAAGDVDGIVRLWDPTSRATATPLADHERHLNINAVAWSPDGAQLATSSKDGTVRLRNAATCATTAVLTGPTDEIYTVAWSPDGTRLATAGTDGSVQLRDLTGAVTATLTGKSHWFNSNVAWSPDGRCIATGGSDGTVWLCDAGTGATTATLIGHATSVYALAWSPDGTRLATGSGDGTVGLWNRDTGATTATFTGHGGVVYGVAWSPDGTRLATGSGDGTVRLWNPDTGATTAILVDDGSPIFAVTWSPDGARLATSCDNGTVHIWDPAAGRMMGADDRPATAQILAWSSDGTRLAAAVDNAVTVVDVDPAVETARIEAPARVDAMACSPACDHLAVATVRGIDLWDVASRTASRLPTGTVVDGTLAWSPNNRHLAIAVFGATVQLWDARTRTRVGELVAPSPSAGAVAWSPDGALLATATKDHKVLLRGPVMNRRRGRTTAGVQRELVGHAEELCAVDWSPDGAYLAGLAHDFALFVWDLAAGRVVARVDTPHRGMVHSVAWSPDGRHVATGDDTGLVIIWDRHGHEVSSLVLQPSQCLAWGAPLLAVGQPGRPALLTLRDPADVTD